MGTGRISPDAPVSRGASGQFSGREAEGTAPLTTYSETLSGQTITDGGGQAEEYLLNSENPDMAQAAVKDNGYNVDIAANYRSMSTDELRDEFNRLVENNADPMFSAAGSPNAKTRFVGGVLASRADSSVSVEDVFNAGNHQGITIEDDENLADFRDPKDAVIEEMDSMLQNVDEYVAGQICSEINAIEIKELEDNVNGRMGFNLEIDVSDATQPGVNPVSEGPGIGDTARSRPKRIRKASISSYDRVDYQDVKTTIRHEMVHAFHSSMDVGKDGTSPTTDDAELNSMNPDRLNLEGTMNTKDELRTDTQKQFYEDVQEAADRIIETEKGELPEGEAPMRTVRGYQKYSYAEVMAVGYELYSNDLISSVNDQRLLADTFDGRLTGHGWEETSIDSLQDSKGSAFDRKEIADYHKPPIVVSQGDYERPDEDDYGEVALFEFTHDIFDGQSHAAGVVTDVSDDSVTFSYCAQEIEVKRGNIESVKRRNWND